MTGTFEQRENLLASKRNDFYVQKCKYKGEKKIQRAYGDIKMINGNRADINGKTQQKRQNFPSQS